MFSLFLEVAFCGSVIGRTALFHLGSSSRRQNRFLVLLDTEEDVYVLFCFFKTYFIVTFQEQFAGQLLPGNIHMACESFAWSW